MPNFVRVFYDGQCEVCQAGVSWLRLLDDKHRIECVPLDPELVRSAGLDLEACSRQLHVQTPQGRTLAGWRAVAYLARRFPATWLIGALGAVPPFSWLARLAYGWVARNRYALSKCRGGSCATSARSTSLVPFWTCHATGMLMRLPLSLGAMLVRIGGNLARFARTYRRRIDLLDGRLKLLLLNGLPCDLPSLLFGEHFLAIVYDGIAIDPGPTRLRRALRRHLKHLPDGSIRDVVATHHHEEHSGNLDWLAAKTGATLHVGDATARCLNASPRLPWIRRLMIGEIAPLRSPFRAIGDKVGDLEAIPTPGHCDDHIALYHRKDKILFAGDCFMGVYFSAPNPDVDSRLWIETLERLLALDIEILIEGHGHIHTLRADIPDNCPLLIRRDPREQILEKLRFCRWLLAQIESGFGEGLPAGAVVATCFPWGRRFAWENFLNDRLSEWFSGGHWSRAELVRSFVRRAESPEVLPGVYEARVFTPREGRVRDRRV